MIPLQLSGIPSLNASVLNGVNLTSPLPADTTTVRNTPLLECVALVEAGSGAVVEGGSARVPC